MRLGSNSPLTTRRTAKELSENKIMSNSNLFKFYLEMNENKDLIRNKLSLTTKESKKERALSIVNFSNYAKLVNEDIKSINKDNIKDIDSKSVPEINHHSFNGNFSDDETILKNTKNLKRVMSLVDGEYIGKKIKDAIMGNLTQIKKRFSNKFKDLDNISDND